VDQVSSTVTRYAELLSLVILAKVTERKDSNAQSRFALTDVGYGLAVEQRGRLVVATGEGADPALTTTPTLPQLGFLEKQVVAGAEESLESMRLLQQRTTVMLIDSPAVFHWQGEHQALTMRSLIWVESATGRLGQFMWLLASEPGKGEKLALPQGAFVGSPTWEERKMRVDATQFSLLGIPNPLAFALIDLPPGKRIAIPPESEAIAAQSQYSAAQFSDLVRALNGALQTP
jgi:hypothetical protein